MTPAAPAPVAAADAAEAAAIRVDPAAIGRPLLAAYALAQVGAYLSFMPLLSILLPLKATAIDPAARTLLLSQLLFFGALVAGASNVAVGIASDRTTSRFGRRRPWILAGVVGTIAAYAVIGNARSFAVLLGGFLLFQVTLNMLLAPLAAIVADRIPDAQKGRVGGLVSVGVPIGSAGGALLVGGLAGQGGWAFAAIAATLAASVLPFLLAYRERAATGAAGAIRGLWLDPRRHPDFAFAWAGRSLFVLVNSLAMGYMLFYLDGGVRDPRGLAPADAVDRLVVLTAIWCATHIGAGLFCGWLSDRIGRRKPFVLAAGLLFASAMALFALVPRWEGVAAGFAILGLGAGAFQTLDVVLMAAVLPSARDTGAHLGMLNLANTVPQMVAPVLALALLGEARQDFTTLFLTAALLALAAAAMVLPIRRVR